AAPGTWEPARAPVHPIATAPKDDIAAADEREQRRNRPAWQPPGDWTTKVFHAADIALVRKTFVPCSPVFFQKRRGRDSNPRSSFPDVGFQDRCNRPLCHPSVYFTYLF